jgi:hypothetical protein
MEIPYACTGMLAQFMKIFTHLNEPVNLLFSVSYDVFISFVDGTGLQCCHGGFFEKFLDRHWN